MNYLFFASLITGILVTLILLYFGVRVQKNNLFLALNIFCLSYALVAVWLIESGAIANMPYLTRVGNIFGYLVFPMLYLFARNTFYPGRLWRRWDFLWLLPAFFYIVDMMPFFLASSSYKIKTLFQNLPNQQEIYTQNEGWLTPPAFHLVARAIWCISINLLLFWLLYRNWRFEQQQSNPANRPVFRFIFMLAILYLPLSFVLLWGTLTVGSWWTIGSLGICIAIPLLAVAIFLLFSPGPLYGFRPLQFIGGSAKAAGEEQPEEEGAALTIQEKKTSQQAESKNTNFGREQSNRYIQQLCCCMDEKQPYTEKGLTIHRLAELSGIPVYIISSVINSELDTNFNNWVNQYRIRYFLQLNADPGNTNYTLEAMANQAGFTNRVTFSNVFKKEMGVSPGKYLKSEVERKPSAN